MLEKVGETDVMGALEEVGVTRTLSNVSRMYTKRKI
jgi:hypothetical protein